MTGPALGALVLVALVVAAAALVHGRDRRRRLALREALHEVRRPLQALLLERPPGSREGALLAQLRVAVSDLADVAEGRPAPPPTRERVSVAELLRDAEERWPGARLAVEPPADGGAMLEGDRVRLGMALDNLIANGLEHGRGGVNVVAKADSSRLRLEVVNGGRAGPVRRRASGGPPRGNGLRIAARHAAADAGRVQGPRESGDRVVAAVELPRPDPPPPAA